MQVLSQEEVVEVEQFIELEHLQVEVQEVVEMVELVQLVQLQVQPTLVAEVVLI
jgi:hypothetical protein